MQTYELKVVNRDIVANSEDMSLVRTSIGMDQVHVLFDSPEWLDFPVKVTFAQGDDIVTQGLVLSAVSNSDVWSAEATVTVPYEVIDMVGKIRVTFQGTDANGNHIITAYGTPLEVEEAGDVVDGTMPADAPTINEWQQAYADAMAAVNRAQTLVTELGSRLSDMVAGVEGDINETISERIAESTVVATDSTLGSVMVGSGLTINSSGVLSTTSRYEIGAEQAAAIANLSALAYYCFDTSFDDDGDLEPTATLKATAIPLESIVDGETITVSEGKLSFAMVSADETGY
jgi:hypothetical protein